MSIAEQYLSLPQYAEKRLSPEATLKRLVNLAEGTQYELGEPDATYGRTPVWHVDKWHKLELFRLTHAINEAVELGFVVTVQASNEWAESRYNDGIEEGRKQGINHIATGEYVSSDDE